MNILLDTHIALWAILDDIMLTDKAREIILDPENLLYYSTVSTWEILLKHADDPKNLYINVNQFIDNCEKAGFIPVNLTNKHIATVETLKYPEMAPTHKDPFDKLILAQAKSENFLLLTHDKKMTYYEEIGVILV